MRTYFLHMAAAWVIVLAGGCFPALGNVYVTNVKLNGLTNNAVVCPGRAVSVGYILNESASAGVLMEILSGTNVLKSISVAGGAPGTQRGTNSLSWDGTNADNLFVQEGLYSIRITASSLGYDCWTQISEDTNSGNWLHDPYAIAVNQNTNSLFYGRVFVGNALDNPFSGQQSGIYKFNADCSSADEGAFSTGGYIWMGYDPWPRVSPWKMEVSQDDNLFVNDWWGYGDVIGFDQVVSSSFFSLLNDSNHPVTNDFVSNLSGPAITGIGTNTQVWMADASLSDSFGIVRWPVGADGVVASNNLGTVVVAAGTNSDLSVAPWDVAVDKNGKIYTIQNLAENDPGNHVLCFPAYDESGLPETNADWKVVGTNDIFALANGIAVNPEATYVGVAVPGTLSQGGGVVILNAANGDILTNLGNGICFDVAWDNVGNVYGSEFKSWRVFSPPGANQATTVALENVQVLNILQKPTICQPHMADGQIQFVLNGQTSVPYIILSSTNLVDWTPIATNYNVSPLRNIQIDAAQEMNFFRAAVGP